jgi:hypothetical protein
MANEEHKINISNSTQQAADYYKQQGSATNHQADETPPADSPRRSPVTDLLFDRPRSGSNGHHSEGTPQTERRRPVYHISIVAEMVETHPQTLRMYERMGLLNPQRTPHNVRLYSEDDVDQVRRIQHLTQDLGVNLAGVEVVFKLLREMHQLREELEKEIADAMRQPDK